MELFAHRIPGGPFDEVVVAPLGDFQWSGPNGSTALTHLQRHIARCQQRQAWFLGVGDYTDFLSPSNRQRLKSAALYDTAEDVIDNKALELMHEIYELALKPTKGQWLGLVEGHHFSQLKDGTTTDSRLAEMLGTRFMGTSAVARVEFLAKGGGRSKSRLVHATIYVHHGTGGGSTPGAPLSKLDRTASGLEDVDVVVMGHTTKGPVARISRIAPEWDKDELNHRDVLLVNAGGFSKSNILGHKSGPLPRGDYAEQGMMMPSALSAPMLYLCPQEGTSRCEVKVLV